jgi:hypothetical protein
LEEKARKEHHVVFTLRLLTSRPSVPAIKAQHNRSVKRLEEALRLSVEFQIFLYFEIEFESGTWC